MGNCGSAPQADVPKIGADAKYVAPAAAPATPPATAEAATAAGAAAVVKEQHIITASPEKSLAPDPVAPAQTKPDRFSGAASPCPSSATVDAASIDLQALSTISSLGHPKSKSIPASKDPRDSVDANRGTETGRASSGGASSKQLDGELSSAVSVSSEKPGSQPRAVQDALMKVSLLIQKFADGNNEGKMPVQLLKRTLNLVIADCLAKSASVHIVSPTGDEALLVAMVGTSGDCYDRLGFQVLGKKSKHAAKMLITSGTDFLSWCAKDGPATAEDWRQVSEAAGLKHLSAVPITRVADKIIGIFTIGFEEETGWQDNPLWPTYMQLIASSMTSMIKDSSITKYLPMIHDIHDSPDIDSLLHQFIAHFRLVLGQTSNTHIWYRIALSSEPNSTATAATIFDDVTQLPGAEGRSSLSSSSLSMSKSHRLLTEIQAAGGITRNTVSMNSTIMKVCVQHRQQVMVPDVQKLLNQSGCVSLDIFNNRLFRPPTSVLVFPLRLRQNIYGAIYCMSSVRDDFADVSIRLREVADFSSPHLLHVLKNTLSEEYALVRAASLNNKQSDSSYTKETSCSGRPEFGSCIGIGGGNGMSGDSFAMAQSRSSTGALVSGLTEKLNEKRIQSSMDFGGEHSLRELQIKHLLGEGGFAKVFRGLWRGLVVGIKVVCDDGKNTKMDMKNAHEIAILSTLSHPNVVQAYICMTDIMVSEMCKYCMRNISAKVHASAAYKYLVANQDNLCHIEVIEYCDLGNLSTALRNQIFFVEDNNQVLENLANAAASGRSDSTPSTDSRRDGQVMLPALILTLIEIAAAMAELHRMGVVHCDIKPPNVLLKSSNMDFRGYTAKVSDFGLSRVEDDEDTESFPFNSCGTAAYVAPEALVSSKKVNSSVDVYAYGILMWEMYTAMRPYGNMKQKELVEEVVLRGLRPKFPDNSPQEFILLAQACWAKSALSRPTFVEIIQILNRMLETYAPGHTCPAALGARSHTHKQSATIADSNERRRSNLSNGGVPSGSGALSSPSPSRPGEKREQKKDPTNWNKSINQGALNLLEMQNGGRRRIGGAGQNE